MVLVLAFLIALTLALLAQNLWMGRPTLGRRPATWGAPPNSDPRVAVAAMLYAVASEDGPVTRDKSEHMLALLGSTLELTAQEAQICLASGKTLSRRLDGSLNSRLHQLRGPIEKNCSSQEREDVVQMLRAVAGANAERVPSIREALGRIAGSLLHG